MCGHRGLTNIRLCLQEKDCMKRLFSFLDFWDITQRFRRMSRNASLFLRFPLRAIPKTAAKDTARNSVVRLSDVPRKPFVCD